MHIRESNNLFNLVIPHFSGFIAFLAIILLIVIIIVTYIEPVFLLLDLFALPFAILLLIKSIIERTIIIKDETHLIIKIVKLFGSDNYRVSLQNVQQIYEGEQLYSDKKFIRFNYGPMGMNTSKNVYRQYIIAIQTNKRVIRIGQEFSEEKVEEVLNYLKEKLQR